jgi:integrase
MEISRLERSRITFMEKIRIKDPKTQEGYKTALNNFENFCMEKFGKTDCIAELKEQDTDYIFEFLQTWINWNDVRSPRTILNWFSRIKKYLHYRGIKLHPQDIKENLEFKIPSQEDLYPLTVDDIQTIIKNLRYKHKTMFVCQASSLMRIGEIVQLRKKHIILGGPNIIVKIPPTITKFHKGRTTYFSKEASKILT